MKDNKNVIIDIEHLSKSFGDHQVLKDISLYIRKGEFVTLLGPSGCGKTTLLRMIAGFLQPDEGTIMMEWDSKGGKTEFRDVAGIPPHQRPLNTVFQRYALFPHLDVYDNIAFGLKLQGVPKDEIDTRVRKVLKLVSMSDYEDRDVESLSGGQQQRVAIARAIVNRPKVLLLDEPLAALDLKMRQDMQIELKEMHQKLGITFIYVTHDQSEALTLSDTVVVMNEGKIQQIGTPIDIYNEPVNSFVADFIGESNILNGTMVHDRKVNFIGHDFECVDEGFGENNPVEVAADKYYPTITITALTTGNQVVYYTGTTAPGTSTDKITYTSLFPKGTMSYVMVYYNNDLYGDERDHKLEGFVNLMDQSGASAYMFWVTPDGMKVTSKALRSYSNLGTTSCTADKTHDNVSTITVYTAPTSGN